jgi:4-hydroxy-4-methyl-2-oxoglutarate aldolase
LVIPKQDSGADECVAQAARLSTATLHEAAGKMGALPSEIKPLAQRVRICGRALPVQCPPGDNLWLHHAIYAARPGEVLVVNTSGAPEFGYWGEVMAVAAMTRGIAGLVLNGGVRDSQRLLEMGFPVFSARVCIQGTRKNPQDLGSIGSPVRFGATVVRRGDVVVGDADGVVVIPAALAAKAIDESKIRDRQEQSIFAQLQQGRSTIEIYGLPQVESP